MIKKKDFGIYRIIQQAGLRQVCTNAQTSQSFPCLHTQSMDIDEVSGQI